jgi:hypothetical protein
MAQKQAMDQLKEFDLNAILAAGTIASELEYQRAKMADRSLLLMSESDPSLNDIRDSLWKLIIQYETVHWSDFDSVTDEQIVESDVAEELASAELEFVAHRRKLILEKLKNLNLKQNDLATLLSHNKSYTSELLNGIRAFSNRDLILIHKLLKIDLEDLLITTLSEEMKQKVNTAIGQIAAKNVKAKWEELTLSNK